MSTYAREGDEAYKYICQEITFKEQLQIFGILGYHNILKQYGRKAAVEKAKDWVFLRECRIT